MGQYEFPLLKHVWITPQKHSIVHGIWVIFHKKTCCFRKLSSIYLHKLFPVLNRVNAILPELNHYIYFLHLLFMKKKLHPIHPDKQIKLVAGQTPEVLHIFTRMPEWLFNWQLWVVHWVLGLIEFCLLFVIKHTFFYPDVKSPVHSDWSDEPLFMVLFLNVAKRCFLFDYAVLIKWCWLVCSTLCYCNRLHFKQCT